MASTRNRNTPGDYQYEQKLNNEISTYSTNVCYGAPSTVHLPGDGLLAGKVGYNDLACNGMDVESFLWGIGSTNLVQPQSEFKPKIKQLKSLHVFDRIPIIIPQPLVVEPNQRPSMK
jgi:hypothetical protein